MFFLCFNIEVQVNAPSFAKVNLDLRILAKRPDNFHELRTIFQTISLKDTLRIGFDFSKHTSIQVDCIPSIPDNLVSRAAAALLESAKVNASVKIQLSKKIPMGAGLGGGSSNAAATLLALNGLIRRPLPFVDLLRLAEGLGSDVPFFLYGGTAVAIGRGTEIYPLSDLAAHHALVVFSGVHVSTAQAYQSLNRDVTNALTSASVFPILREFQSITGSLQHASLQELPLKNDFQDAVFNIHPSLANNLRKLRRFGANPALLTGSGSAVFGVFSDSVSVCEAAASFSKEQAFPVRFVTRNGFRQAWKKALRTA